MNLNFFKKKKYFNIFITLFFFLYFLIGIYASLNTGVSHDEFHEQNNWEFNLSLVDNLLKNQEFNTDYIDLLFNS